jgi:hypothetical protein
MDGLLAIHVFLCPHSTGISAPPCKQFHSVLPISYAADFPDSYVSLKEEERRTLIVSDDV